MMCSHDVHEIWVPVPGRLEYLVFRRRTDEWCFVDPTGRVIGPFPSSGMAEEAARRDGE